MLNLYRYNSNELEQEIELAEYKIPREVDSLLLHGFHKDLSEFPEDLQANVEALKFVHSGCFV